MRQYSIQSVLDWLEFKCLLKNRSHAEAAILCDLNSSSFISSIKNSIQLIGLFIACFTCITVLFVLEQPIIAKYQSLAFILITLITFTIDLIPKKCLWLPPLLTGCFIAIGFEAAYLALTGNLQPLYHQSDMHNIFLLSGLIFIVTWQLLTLKHDRNFTFSTFFFTLSLIFCSLLGFLHPVILMALLITLSGYTQTNILLIGFGLCLTTLTFGWVIYNWNITWDQKSILMMGLGFALLLLKALIQYFDWQDEG